MKFLNEIDGADKLKQDENNRLVSDSQIEGWGNPSSTKVLSNEVRNILSQTLARDYLPLYWENSLRGEPIEYLATDRNGNSLITDTRRTLHKLDGAGEILWEIYRSGSYFRGIGIDSQGSVFTSDKTPNSLIKISPLGDIIWEKTYNPVLNTIRDIKVDLEDNVYLATESGFVIKMNNNGDMLWQYFAGSEIRSIALNILGEVYSATRDAKVFRLSPGGSLVKEYVFDKTSLGRAYALAIREDLDFFVGFDSGALLRVSETGEIVKNYTKRTDSVYSLSLSRQNDLYVSDRAGFLSRLNEDGSKNWEIFLDSKLEALSITDNQELIVAKGIKGLQKLSILGESIDLLGPSAYLGSSYSLKNASFSGDSFSDPALYNARAVDFNSDGTIMYWVGRDTNSVVSYDLDTPWDLSSSKYREGFSLAGQVGTGVQTEAVPHGIFLKKDGSSMYIWNRSEIWVYNLNFNWVLTSAVYSSYQDFSSVVQRGHDIEFDVSGLNMYVDDRGLKKIHHFKLSTSWDVTTATLYHSLDISNVEKEVRGIQLNKNGTKMFLLNTLDQNLLEYDLKSPWEIAGAVFNRSLYIGAQGSNPRNITWKHDGQSFFITQTSSMTVFRYVLETEEQRRFNMKANKEDLLLATDDVPDYLNIVLS